MKKKIMFIIGLVVFVFVIFAIIFIKNDYLFVITTESGKFTYDYEKLNGELSIDDKEYPKVNISDNKMVYKSIDEVLNVLYDGTGVIYIGYPECIYCRSAVQVLVDTSNKTEIEEIYYLDISEVWDILTVSNSGEIEVVREANDKYYNLLDDLVDLDDYFLDDYVIKDNSGKKVNTGKKRIKVPIVLFVVDGEIVSSNVYTLFSQEDPYIELDKDQKIGLSNIYRSGINDVLNRLNAGY